MTSRTTPEADSRFAIALATGSCSDAGYSRSEYALTLRNRQGLTTLAACRFDDPDRTIQRALHVWR